MQLQVVERDREAAESRVMNDDYWGYQSCYTGSSTVIVVPTPTVLSARMEPL